MITATLAIIALAQIILAMRLLPQFARALAPRRIPPGNAVAPFSLSIVVPVLNEESRLPAALDAILAEAAAVPELIDILIVDGGSSDGTAAVVQSRTSRGPRLQWIDASPVPVDAVGKAWGLLQGTNRARGDWVLTLDADTIIAPGLIRSLAAFVHSEHLDALSVATRQASPGWMQSLLHPAFLTTLVYRFGPPGYATTDPRRVMANGQCFFASRAALTRSDAIDTSLASLCEDITIARTLARAGHQVGFFESSVPVTVQMYGSAAELWANWPRSLAMRDHVTDGRSAARPFASILLLQAAPLPLLAGSLLLGLPPWFTLVQAVLFAFRLGVLFGTSRAYARHAASYWLSPLADLPVAARLLHAVVQRRLVWRGRVYERGPDGRIRAMAKP